MFTGLAKWQIRVQIGLAALALIATVWFVWLKRHDGRVIQRREAEVVVKQQQARVRAEAGVAVDQAAKAESRAQDRKEFNDATATLKDRPLSDRQRIDLCIELRAAGYDITRYPACAALAARGETGALASHPDD